MFPRAFHYHRAGSLKEAATMLAQLGPEARLLAGGQSLIPLMKLRFASPPHLSCGSLKMLCDGRRPLPQLIFSASPLNRRNIRFQSGGAWAGYSLTLKRYRKRPPAWLLWIAG